MRESIINKFSLFHNYFNTLCYLYCKFWLGIFELAEIEISENLIAPINFGRIQQQVSLIVVLYLYVGLGE